MTPLVAGSHEPQVVGGVDPRSSFAEPLVEE